MTILSKIWPSRNQPCSVTFPKHPPTVRHTLVRATTFWVQPRRSWQKLKVDDLRMYLTAHGSKHVPDANSQKGPRRRRCSITPQAFSRRRIWRVKTTRVVTWCQVERTRWFDAAFNMHTLAIIRLVEYTVMTREYLQSHQVHRSNKG